MRNPALLALCISLHPLIGSSEEPPKMAQVVKLVRDYVSSNPTVKTNAEYDVRPFTIEGLWERMRLQIYNVEYWPAGRGFGSDTLLILYRDGKVSELAPCQGGSGLMSAIVCGADLYYTYSWGSGIHRSHFAKLQIVDGRLKYWESSGRPDMDLFVSGTPDGKIQVFSGVYKRFNEWSSGKRIGFLGVGKDPSVQMFEVSPPGPSFPRRNGHDGAANRSHSIRSDTVSALLLWSTLRTGDPAEHSNG